MTRVSACETSQRRKGEEEDAHEVLEVGHAVGVPQARDVADVDRLGAAAARHEDVGLVAEVRRVAEVGAIGDDVTICELAIVPVSEESLERSKLLTMTRALARRMSSSRSRPFGSCAVPEPSMTAREEDVARQDEVEQRGRGRREEERRTCRRFVLGEEDLVCAR